MLDLVPAQAGPATSQGAAARRARALAFYLPQFYPTRENDAWWGPGFTEWTNVARARPLFDGHYQPRLPGELGFYDLRLPEIRARQAQLAAEHAIEGFCYWHYWFAGTRLLDRPFQEVLDSGTPDYPFCLSWANESWSRRWHGTGNTREVLQEQTYSAADDLAHIRWLSSAFADQRYVRVKGRPIFLVYRPFDLPEPQRTTETFRKEAVRLGLPEPYLIGINAHNPSKDTRPLGFDITLNFEPQLSAVPGVNEPGLKITDYTLATRAMRAQPRNYPFHPVVMVGWDNTARRGAEGIVFINSTPAAFGDGLRNVVDSLQSTAFDERLVFLNAWNEWAEGNHLEPDLRYGRGWLEAARDVLRVPGRGSGSAVAVAQGAETLVQEVADEATKATVRRQLEHLSDWDYHHLQLDQVEGRETPLPPLPPYNLQRKFNGAIDVATNVAISFRFYQLVLRRSRSLGPAIGDSSRILDFGCGWGRVVRSFLRDTDPSGLYGLDIEAVGIEACQKAIPEGQFSVIGPSDPIPYPDAFFDVAYACSVFSHLPEALHLSRLQELTRVLKPGGLLVASTLPLSTIQVAAEVREHGFRAPWEGQIASSFPDSALEKLVEGQFVFGPHPREDYGQAIIPRSYVERVWTTWLDIQEFMDDLPGFTQAVIVATKPPRPKATSMVSD